MESILNGTTSTVLADISGSKLLFSDDGLRQPPLYTASNNLIIMIMGLSILIVPVVCFVICMCPRTRIFESLRNLKLSKNGHGDSSKLPYSQFDSENVEPNMKIPVPKDVRVLIHSDNTAPGSPKYSNNGSGESICNITKKSTALKPSASSSSLEFSTIDLDPTFVSPGPGNSSLNHEDHDHYSS